MNPTWCAKATVYELYVDKFAGNFSGLAAKLDYFENLGIDCLHVLPHYPSPMIDGGYDVSDYRNVRSDLGTLNDFINFITKAHDQRIRVIVDFVLNHTSAEHSWFKEARQSRRAETRDYYFWSKTGLEYREAPNPFSNLKPNNWIYNSPTKDYYFATFYPEQPDLNWGNPRVFEEMLSIINFWLSLGVDGFRLDAVPYIAKQDGTNCQALPESHAILKRLRTAAEKINPEVIFLGEASGELDQTKEYFGSGDECQLLYEFPLAAEMILALYNKNYERVYRLLKKANAGLPDGCYWLAFLRNHDELHLKDLAAGERKKLISAIDPVNQYPFKFGVSLRMAEISKFLGGENSTLGALNMLFKLPTPVMIYYGEEIGMKNLPANREIKDSRLCVRGDFDWSEAAAQRSNPHSLFSKVSYLIKERADLAGEKITEREEAIDLQFRPSEV
ncbi:MAG TPA: alpha-amylase family glycosyl hydrolase [Candidatus Tyrphobacter sp.]|nr:alpha-amylase family glycosyl hydrolase [Candidatus Tyrphobacter sp.]